MMTSVIVCFYDRIDLLKCCLDALSLNAGHFDEVVIADDGSAATVVEEIGRLVPRYGFPVVHAWHERRGARRSATRNNGIRHARGEYLVFVDADFAALPGTIEAHVRVARPGQFAAGRVKYTTQQQCERILKEGASAGLLETIYRELPDKPILREHREFIRYGILNKLGLAQARRQTFGGHFSVFREDIESVNGYDENYVGWGGEDQDMAHRMVLAGFAGRSVIRGARMLHLWHTREMGEKHWREGTNVDYYLRENVSSRCENGLVKDSGKAGS